MATEVKERASLVDEFKQTAETRLKELEPLVQEAEEIRAALDRVKGNGNVSSPRSRSPQQRQQRTRRRGRGGVDRSQEFVDLVKANPGIKVSEAAKRMKLNAPNYLYRITPGLEEEGLIRKEGTGYHPA